MPATKITVNHNGSIRIEGEFEIFDPKESHSGWLAGRLSALPLRTLRQQALLRRLP